VLAILMGTRNIFAKIFTMMRGWSNSRGVLPYVALFQIADGLNGIAEDHSGHGRQHIGAAVNIVSYYCGALPLGIWLAFHGWGLPGLWVGQCIALYLVALAEWVIVAFSNWEYQSRRLSSEWTKTSWLRMVMVGPPYWLRQEWASIDCTVLEE